MPIARYFIFVGSTLAALLFFSDWYLPTPTAMFAIQRVAFERPAIRIKSQRKWPERIVLDAGLPVITAPIDEHRAVQPELLPSDEAKNRTHFNAMAQLKSDTRLSAVDHPHVKRRVAETTWSRRPNIRQLVKLEADTACCQFTWVDDRQTISSATTRRRAASSRNKEQPAFSMD